MKFHIFCNVTLCQLLKVYGLFGGVYSSLLGLLGYHLPVDSVQGPRRLYFSTCKWFTFMAFRSMPCWLIAIALPFQKINQGILTEKGDMLCAVL